MEGEFNKGMSIFDNDIVLGDNQLGIFEDAVDENEQTIVPEGEESGTDEQDINTDDQETGERVVGDESEEGDEDPNKSDDDADTSSSDIYSSLATVLSEEGIISLAEDSEIKSADDIANAVKEQIKRAEYSDLTETQKQYLDALRNGVPNEVAQEMVASSAQWEKITEEIIEENADVRYRLIAEDLKQKGFSDERIKKTLKLYVDSGEDFEEAKLAKQSLQETDKLNQAKKVKAFQEEQARVDKAKEESLKKVKDFIYSDNELIKGSKSSESFKEKVYKSMMTPVETNDDGTPINALVKFSKDNPEEYTAKLYYLWELTNGFKNIKTVETQTKSKAVKDLEETLKRNNSARPTSDGSTFMVDPNSYSSVSDFEGHELAD